MNSNPPNDRGWKSFLLGLYLAGIACITLIAWQGWSFYAASLTDRPRHEGWDFWHPGAIYGHGLGIIGTVLILLLLLYIPRKRIRSWERFGSLKRWLDVHIWMGIFGPLLIILHSSFKFGGLVSFSFWSMVAVALSGVLGRYLYLQIPRNAEGHELSQNEIQMQLHELSQEAGSTAFNSSGNTTGGFLNWLSMDLRWFLGKGRLLKQLKQNQAAKPEHVLQLIRKRDLLRRRAASLELARRLLHHWHVFHRPFAFIMVLFMVIHVVTVLLFGARLFHGAN